jgi:hypothetical protein
MFATDKKLKSHLLLTDMQIQRRMMMEMGNLIQIQKMVINPSGHPQRRNICLQIKRHFITNGRL